MSDKTDKPLAEQFRELIHEQNTTNPSLAFGIAAFCMTHHESILRALEVYAVAGIRGFVETQLKNQTILEQRIEALESENAVLRKSASCKVARKYRPCVLCRGLGVVNYPADPQVCPRCKGGDKITMLEEQVAQLHQTSNTAKQLRKQLEAMDDESADQQDRIAALEAERDELREQKAFWVSAAKRMDESTPELNEHRDRCPKLKGLKLEKGSHPVSHGVCLMEAVALFSGEAKSDHPKCACPVLTSFGISWNDGMRSDEEREQLKQYIPLLVGTRSTPEVEKKRAELSLRWLVNVHAPAWLQLAGLGDHALKLRECDPLNDGGVIAAARAASRAAARSAAGAAAGDAAWAASWDAAWAASWDAARSAAGAAAWDAARAAAGDALEPTAQELQKSAHALFRSMIEVESDKTDKTHCQVCGYTKEDAIQHGDHHLCRNHPNMKDLFRVEPILRNQAGEVIDGKTEVAENAPADKKTLAEQFRELTVDRFPISEADTPGYISDLLDFVGQNADEILRALHIQHVHDLIDQLGLAETGGNGNED